MADQTYDLKIVIGAEGVKSIDLVDGKIDKLGHTSAETGSRANALTGQLTRLAGIAAGMISVGAAASAYMGFGAEMSNVGSVANATQAELQQLEMAARKQAAASVFSARESASAQYYLASAGQSVNQIMASQKGVMNLAAATQSDLAQSSATVAATLSQFQMEAGESARVADVYANAISGSQANLTKLQVSMGYVGPVAHSLNMSLEETTATLMALYNNGYDASQAGTILRGSLSALLNPTDKEKAALDRLGISVADSHGKMKPFVDIVDELGRSGVDTGTLLEIFGDRAGPGMAALIATGADAIKKMEAGLYEQGRASKMASQQTDNLKGDVKMFGSATEEAAIALGRKLDPALRGTVQAATYLVNEGTILTSGISAVTIATLAWKAETALASAGAVGLTGKVRALFSVIKAHPYAMAALAIGAAVTATVAYISSVETAAERAARLQEETRKATEEYNRLAKETSRLEGVLEAVGRAMDDVADGRTTEDKAIRRLVDTYPDLNTEYVKQAKNLKDIAEHLGKIQAINEKKQEAQREEQLRKANAQLQEYTDQLERFRDDVGKTTTEVDGLWAAMSDPNQISGPPSQDMGIASTIKDRVRQAKELGEAYDKLKDLEVELAGQKGLEAFAEKIGKVQAQLKAALETASKSSVKSVADAAAGQLREIERWADKAKQNADDLLKKNKDAGKSATSAVTAFNEDQLKANAKIYDEIAKLSLDRYDYERQQARQRYQDAVANNEDVFAAHTRMVLELKKIDDEAAEDRQKAMDKESEAAKRLADERISAEQRMHSKLSGQKENGLNHSLWLLDREMAELRSKTDNAVLLAEYEAARKKEINAKHNQGQVDGWASVNKQMTTASDGFFGSLESTGKSIIKSLATDGFDGMSSAWETALDRMLGDFIDFGLDLAYEVGKWGLSELFNMGSSSGSVLGSIISGLGSALGLTNSGGSSNGFTGSFGTVASIAGTGFEMATGQSVLGAIGSAIGLPTAWTAIQTALGFGTQAASGLAATGLGGGGIGALGFGSGVGSGLGAGASGFTSLGAGSGSFLGAIGSGATGLGTSIGGSTIYTGLASTGLGGGGIGGLGFGGTGLGSGSAASAAGVGFSIGPGMATAGMLAAAELFAMAMGEPGPTEIFAGAMMDAFGMVDKNAMTAEEAQHIVVHQADSLASQSAAAAAGDWSTDENAFIDGLAFAATKRYGAGNSIASVGGISAEEIEAQVAALGPYAQALYDVQTITWEVSDALMAYNDAAERGIFMAADQAEEFRAMALELGITEAQYRSMTDAGWSYEQIASAVTDTAGDLRVAMLDVAGAMERAAVETGMGADQADDYAAQAAALWDQVQAGQVPLTAFDAWLESTAQNLGLSADGAVELADRLENMLSAATDATGGAADLSVGLAALAAENDQVTAATASAADGVVNFDNVVGGAADSAWGLIDVVGSASDEVQGLENIFADANESAETMSATFVSWADSAAASADGAAALASEVSDLEKAFSGLSVLSNVALAASITTDATYHHGGTVRPKKYHTGGRVVADMFAPLSPDEVLAIMKVDEEVTPDYAVTPWTKSQLDHIRLTGQPVPTGGGGSVVQHNTFNLHFQSAPKDDDEMRDFAERLDRIMRDVAKQSYGGA